MSKQQRELVNRSFAYKIFTLLRIRRLCIRVIEQSDDVIQLTVLMRGDKSAGNIHCHRKIFYLQMHTTNIFDLENEGQPLR